MQDILPQTIYFEDEVQPEGEKKPEGGASSNFVIYTDDDPLATVSLPQAEVPAEQLAAPKAKEVKDEKAAAGVVVGIDANDLPDCQNCLRHVFVIDAACAAIKDLLTKYEGGKYDKLERYSPLLKQVYSLREDKLKEKQEQLKKATEKQKAEASKPQQPIKNSAPIDVSAQNLEHFKKEIKQIQIESTIVNIDGIQQLGQVHDVEINPATKNPKFFGEKYTAVANMVADPPKLLELTEIPVPLLKCVYKKDYEIHFKVGLAPEVYQNGKLVLKIANVFDDVSGKRVSSTNQALYFREQGASLVRVTFQKIEESMGGADSTIKADVVAKEVDSYLARELRVWYLSKNGEIKSNAVGACLRLGNTKSMDSNSGIFNVGENLLAIWHSYANKKNYFVLFAPNLQSLHCMSSYVNDGRIGVTLLS